MVGTVVEFAGSVKLNVVPPVENCTAGSTGPPGVAGWTVSVSVTCSG